MLIYNYQKELIGADELILKRLGFANLSQLIAQRDDFADLFVKKAGYIHNFKHVHWIDFIACAEANQESKVIISVDGRNFSCNLGIRALYLKDDHENMGYAIDLLNFKALSQRECDIKKEQEPKEPTIEHNSQLACDELGLSLELIEEFVEDFVAQADEFKAEIYSSLNSQEVDRVKTLSHKLKGVAANLRIEDAFEALTRVNSSKDILYIEQNLDRFYEIIDSLSSGKKPELFDDEQKSTIDIKSTKLNPPLDIEK